MTIEEYTVDRLIRLEAQVKNLQIENEALNARIDKMIDDKEVIRKYAELRRLEQVEDGKPYISFSSIWNSNPDYETIKKALWLTEQENSDEEN